MEAQLKAATVRARPVDANLSSRLYHLIAQASFARAAMAACRVPLHYALGRASIRYSDRSRPTAQEIRHCVHHYEALSRLGGAVYHSDDACYCDSHSKVFRNQVGLGVVDVHSRPRLLLHARPCLRPDDTTCQGATSSTDSLRPDHACLCTR